MVDEEAGEGGGEGEKAAGGSGLPWEGDDKRDYKYEEMLGERIFEPLTYRCSSRNSEFACWGCRGRATISGTTSTRSCWLSPADLYL